MNKKILLVFLFLIFGASLLEAQDFLGQHSSNYAGINRATFNPSAIAGTRYRFHVNLVSFNASVTNRYFKFFRSDALFHPFRHAYTDHELYGKSKLTGTLTQGSNVHLISELRLPSGYVGLGKNNWLVVGFQSRMRGFVQGNDVPSVVKDVYTKRLDFGQLSTSSGRFSDMVLNQLSFFETALTFAAMPLRLEGIGRVKVGATIKRLSGARNVFLHVKNTNYQVRLLNQEDAVFDLSNLNYEYGYTQPVQPFSIGSLFSGDYGSGTALDLGATVELGRIRQHSQDRANYIVRLGAALTDVGEINYPDAAQRFSGTRSRLTLNQEEIIKLGDNSAQQLQNLLGKSNPQQYGYKTVLPANLNVDLDVQFARSFFVNATWIKPTQTGRLPEIVYQPEVFTLTSRFEGEDVEFTLPISWIEGNASPTIGFSVRLGPGFIGFSNFGGLASRQVQPRGTVAYLGFQLWRLNHKAGK
ncbi:MAG: DUF5723 family protein [Runella sp.]